VLVLFLACVFAPLIAMRWAGPWAGIGVAIVAIAAWAKFGPLPIPGLLPGLFAVYVVFQNIGVVVWCAVTIARSLL
jgi:hypothetical protein